MTRTQISLSQDDLDALDEASRRTGSSRSELIRRAVRERYGTATRMTIEEKLAALEASAGLWADRPFTTEEYLDAIRHGRPLPDE
jgi:hypothetical protein